MSTMASVRVAPRVAIVGGGIGGLALALSLHRAGIECDVYESVPDVREIGVGITLLPHAMREITLLGLHQDVEAAGIENAESVFCNRWGQFIYREPRGRHAGYALPEISLHRGRLHSILYRAAIHRVGAARIHLCHRLVALEQGDAHVALRFQSSAGAAMTTVEADIVIAGDGVNSAVRAALYPQEKLAFGGINTWRGVTVHAPILTGKSYMRIGSIDTGKMVIYPIADNVDGTGRQLVNWVAEIRRENAPMNDWNKPGRPEDFIAIFEDWHFDWLDVPQLIRDAPHIFEYPMVDRDPVPRWTFGRVTLLGDAAHPMYPRGSNGSAQALIDARVLADLMARQLAASGDPRDALVEYERLRLPATSSIVETNRTVPPDYIIMKVDALTNGEPFGNIDDVISQGELRKLSDEYKQVAGFSLDALKH